MNSVVVISYIAVVLVGIIAISSITFVIIRVISKASGSARSNQDIIMQRQKESVEIQREMLDTLKDIAKKLEK
ncbi:MAG: hypothetical protein ABL867_08670 [Rickettsiales bacterium]|mgnify:CR=1 FL=1